MEKIKIPLPESIKKQVDEFYRLASFDGFTSDRYFVVPSLPTESQYYSHQEQYNVNYLMRSYKSPRAFTYHPKDKIEQVFYCYWIVPEFEIHHENFYVPDAEYNAKYNKVLFSDTAKPEPDPVTETEDVGASS